MDSYVVHIYRREPEHRSSADWPSESATARRQGFRTVDELWMFLLAEDRPALSALGGQSLENDTMKKLELYASFVTCASGSMADAQESRPTVSVATAKKMADACEARARTEGWKMIIAVVDEGANLKYFRRMDGAFLGSIQIAQLKANTAAAFPVSTKQLGEIADKQVPGLVHVPGFLMIEGGAPILTARASRSGRSASRERAQSRMESARKSRWTRSRRISSRA